MGLGRVGEIFVVYRREIRKNENSVKAAECGGGREDYGYERVSAGIQK